MKHNIKKRIRAAFLAAAVALQSAVLPAAGIPAPFSLTAYADPGQGIVNTDRMNVRSGPGTSYGKVTTLGAGTQVTITGETTGSDGALWYSISFAGGSGYARHDFINNTVVYATQGADFETWLDQQGFPESYKNGLRGLHQKYPNWVFRAFQTGLDWNMVIAEESKIGRNLVDKNSISSWKSIAPGAFDWAGNYWPGFDGATWVQASEALIRYYMDPRNFLTDPYIFQFEHQVYNPAIQTREGLKTLVAGTFLDGDAIVPVEGSVVEGGTIIEGSTYGGASSVSGGAAGPGPSAGSSGSSSGYTVVGPGGSTSSSSGGYAVVGPGMGSVSSGGDAAAPVQEDAVITISGPVMNTGELGYGTVISDLFGSLTGRIDAYAASWRQEESRWVYVLDDGSLMNDGWHWLDGNNDGIAECYYFYEDGTMAADTLVEGYRINSDGQWVHSTGEPYTKSVGVSGSSEGQTAAAADSSVPAADSAVPASGQLKRVPYVDILMKAAETSGVSPYVLASSILQEQGKGTSDLISGKHSKYPGYYNFYNTGAYAHDGMSAVEAGLKYASESGNGGRPWNTIEKAIIGGASAYGASYVAQGQDTFYFKKFNVQGSNKFNHQFMTHVLAAASEGARVSNAYSSAMKAGAMEFSIPVYLNMPGETSPLPAGDGSPNNKLSGLSVDGYQITPTFQMDTTEYSLIVDGSSAYVNIQAQPIDSSAVVSGAGSVALNVGGNDVVITVRAGNGDERTYRINITRREDSNVSYTGGPVFNGSTDANGAVWTNSSGTAAGPGPGAAEQPAAGSTSETAGYTVVGPGGGVSVPTDQSGQHGQSDVLIGSAPQ